ncbi:MAG: MurR/RpiR family transcriptional regulator, partial [Lactococcus sp.]|nr:MurR/RpiR family transcriptional regulator [Lactococcus sp.]
MNLEILITQSQKNLSDMDLEILAYVVKHQKQVQNANIIDLSKAVHVSKSSVLRMTKKLGFSGYTEFKYFLKQ